MGFVYLPFPKALKQAFLCTWAKYVVMPQEKEPVSDWWGMEKGRMLEAKQKPSNPQATRHPCSGGTGGLHLLWGWDIQSQILLPGAFLMGSGSLGLEATCPVPCTPRPTILKASCQGRRVWQPPR